MSPIKLLKLVNAFRIRGHFAANLDPLGAYRRESKSRWLPDDPKDYPDIVKLVRGNESSKRDLSPFGLDDVSQTKKYFVGDIFHTRGSEESSSYLDLTTLIQKLSKSYCGNVGVEFSHIEKEKQRLWLIDKIENVQPWLHC